VALVEGEAAAGGEDGLAEPLPGGGRKRGAEDGGLLRLTLRALQQVEVGLDGGVLGGLDDVVEAHRLGGDGG
jgi:hypothetical protein